MLEFDPNDPFPLTDPAAHTYGETQVHSEQVDAWLGLKTYETERALVAMNQSRDPRDTRWVGLPVQALLTPYTELREILDRLKPKPRNRVVDLGAGYGRMGFVIGRHYPQVEFLGFEAVSERVNEGEKCFAERYPTATNLHLILADIASPSFQVPSADYYFIYDYSDRASIEKTVTDLRKIAKSRPVCVVGRGRATRDVIERAHPWLSQVYPVQNFPHYSIYRSAPAEV